MKTDWAKILDKVERNLENALDDELPERAYEWLDVHDRILDRIENEKGGENR